MAVHLLLEHVDPATLALDPAVAQHLLETSLPLDLPGTEPGQIAALRASVLAEVEAVLASEPARTVFGPDSLPEVSLAIDNPMPEAEADGMRMLGRIDRLVLSGDRALIVDLKSDGAPPRDLAGVSTRYLAQLGAYQSAAREIWPDRTVETAILWTRTATLMPVPLDVADHAYRTSRWDLRQT